MARALAAAPGWRSTTATAVAPSISMWSWRAGSPGDAAPAAGGGAPGRGPRGGAVGGDGRLGGGAGPGAELGGHIGHVGPAEALVGEPLLEGVPEGLQGRPGVVAGPRGLAPQPAQPQPAPALHGGRDQRVLAAEVAVEGHRGDVGLGDDPVDGGGADALLGEEPGRRVQDPLAWPGGRHDSTPRETVENGLSCASVKGADKLCKYAECD